MVAGCQCFQSAVLPGSRSSLLVSRPHRSRLSVSSSRVPPYSSVGPARLVCRSHHYGYSVGPACHVACRSDHYYSRLYFISSALLVCRSHHARPSVPSSRLSGSLTPHSSVLGPPCHLACRSDHYSRLYLMSSPLLVCRSRIPRLSVPLSR